MTLDDAIAICAKAAVAHPREHMGAHEWPATVSKEALRILIKAVQYDDRDSPEITTIIFRAGERKTPA